MFQVLFKLFSKVAVSRYYIRHIFIAQHVDKFFLLLFVLCILTKCLHTASVDKGTGNMLPAKQKHNENKVKCSPIILKWKKKLLEKMLSDK